MANRTWVLGDSRCSDFHGTTVFFKINLPKNEDRAWVAAPMDLPQREFFVRSLGSAVALSACWQIKFLCVRFWRSIQLYKRWALQKKLTLGVERTPSMNQRGGVNARSLGIELATNRQFARAPAICTMYI